MLGSVVVSQKTFDDSFARPGDAVTLVQSSQPVDRLAEALGRFPDARVVSDDTFVKERVAEIDEILNLLYALLALSVIVSLFGMVNTLVLSVFERTREIGMLRAVGLTRRQTRRMIRHESVVTALIGAALGLPLGILLATGSDPRALGVRPLALGSAWTAVRVRVRRGPRGNRGRRAPGAPRCAPERAPGAAVRIGDRAVQLRKSRIRSRGSATRVHP